MSYLCPLLIPASLYSARYSDSPPPPGSLRRSTSGFPWDARRCLPRARSRLRVRAPPSIRPRPSLVPKSASTRSPTRFPDRLARRFPCPCAPPIFPTVRNARHGIEPPPLTSFSPRRLILELGRRAPRPGSYPAPPQLQGIEEVRAGTDLPPDPTPSVRGRRQLCLSA
ncbi:hypothetical protein B0H15DRAFT_845715 [Mycena belliarum]|uniref:Uncharacterized protein n=1 Tax=Mycena belliarum TaxID=1033014 RepID=A0AAD6U103_9AGAR|nr:hypothetical protein B0H15DRAFT_845715 [Mycena belliae]